MLYKYNNDINAFKYVAWISNLLTNDFNSSSRYE